MAKSSDLQLLDIKFLNFKCGNIFLSIISIGYPISDFAMSGLRILVDNILIDD